MLGKFIKKEDRFFKLFNNSADLIVEGARELKHLVVDIQKSEIYSRNIKDIEHKADQNTHKTVSLLHKTFITPLDREDIHKLITNLDDILDFLDASASRIFIYGVNKTNSDLKIMADICLQVAEKVKSAVNQLENLKNPEEIIKICIDINRLENEADNALRSAVAKLFKEETDIKELVKLKEIYELLETVTDRCEDVANIIEGIVLEYS